MQTKHKINQSLFIFGLMLFIFGAACPLVQAQILQTGKTFEREIGGAERHSYNVQLKKDEAYNLVVEQRGVDVVLRVYSPDGSLAADMDTPNGTQGDESLLFVPLVSGNYRIEIALLNIDAPKGKYFIKTVATRAATGTERGKAQLKNDLMTVVRALDDANNRGDKAAAMSLIADDYINASAAGGIFDKAIVLNEFPDSKEAGKIKATETYSNVRVRDYGETALLSFINDSQIQAGEQTLNDRFRVIQIYRRNNGKWQIAAQQSTLIKKVQDPPIVKLDPKVLSTYAGQYEIAPDVILNVESDGEKLLLFTKNEANKNAWYPMSENTFFYKGGAQRTIFVRDVNGKVTEAIHRSDDGQELKARKIK